MLRLPRPGRRSSPTREGLQALAELPYQELLEFELLAVLGYPASTNPLDHRVAPRGYRVLSHIPRLPETVIRRVVDQLEGLDAIVRASQRELEAVERRRQRSARGRSARGSGASRSTTWSTATFSL